MRSLLHILDGSYDSLFFEQLLEIIQESRLMFIEKFLSPQVLIRRDHDIIQVAIGNLQIIEIANIPVRGNLRPHSHISHSGKLTLLHEADLLRVVVTPLQRPAFLLLKL